MKVKCIKKDDCLFLTIDKTYEVLKFNFNGCYDEYQIIDDDGDLYYCPVKCFKSLSEYRIERINKISEE